MLSRGFYRWSVPKGSGASQDDSLGQCRVAGEAQWFGPGHGCSKPRREWQEIGRAGEAQPLGGDGSPHNLGNGWPQTR